MPGVLIASPIFVINSSYLVLREGLNQPLLATLIITVLRAIKNCIILKNGNAYFQIDNCIDSASNDALTKWTLSFLTEHPKWMLNCWITESRSVSSFHIDRLDELLVHRQQIIAFAQSFRCATSVSIYFYLYNIHDFLTRYFQGLQNVECLPSARVLILLEHARRSRDQRASQEKS